jgi:hypothetical protein
MEAAEYPIVVGILLTISILGGTANSLVIALFVRNKKASPLYCLRSTLHNISSKSHGKVQINIAEMAPLVALDVKLNGSLNRLASKF